MEYYRISEDINFFERWYLGDISVEDNWIFNSGKAVDTDELKDLSLDIYQHGVAMDFTFTEVYAVPIVSNSFAEFVFE
jgi:hypothetical protein